MPPIRILTVFVAIVLCSTRLAAQQADNPLHYETTIQGSFTAGYCAGGSYFQITDETGNLITNGAGGGSGGPATTTYGTFSKVKLTPGKEYTISTGSSGLVNIGNPPAPYMRYANLTVHFSSSVNIYLNGSQVRSVTVAATSGSSFKVRVGAPGAFPLENAPAYLRGGDCSQLVIDKPIWYLGLGRLRNGDSAGSVGFRRGDFSGNLFTPAALYYTSPDPAEVAVIQQSGAIRQIFSREVLVDVQTLSATSYRLDVYPRSSIGTLSGGLYPINSGEQPFAKYTIEKITAGSDEGIKITRDEDGKLWHTSLRGNSTARIHEDWKLSSETNVMEVETAYTSSTSAEITQTGPLSNGTGQHSPLIYTKSYTDYGGTWGKELYTRSMAPFSSNPLVSYYTYHTTTSTSDNSFERSIKTELNASGGWARYEYYAANSSIGSAGSIKRIYRPWLSSHNNPDTANTSNSAWEERTYYNGYWNLPASAITTAPGSSGQVLSKTTWSYNLAPGTINGDYYYESVRNDFWGLGSSDYLSTTTKKYRWDSSLSLREKPISVSYPTGRKEAWAYFNGTWDDSLKQFTASASGDARQVLKFEGQTGGGTPLSSWSQNGQSRTLDALHMVEALSTVKEEITDKRGLLVMTATYVYTSSGTLDRISAVHHRYDSHGRPFEEVDLIRSTSSLAYKTSRVYEGSAITEETGVDGVVTKYEFNGFLQLKKKTTGLNGDVKYPAKIEEFLYDGAGRLEYAYTCACSTGATIYTYDDAGRIESASEKSPHSGNLTTTYTYPNPQTTELESPSGALKITEVYLDGRTKSVTGSGTKPTYYSFDLLSSGTRMSITHAGQADASWGWEETKYDLLGRPIEMTRPTWNWPTDPNAVLITETSYDAGTGLVSKVKLKDNATSSYPFPNTLYLYSYGRLIAEGQDLDGDNTLDAGETDRFVSFGLRYVYESGNWHLESTKTGYLESNSSTATQIQKTKTRLTGFSTITNEIVDVESEVTDAVGQTTTVRESVNPAEKSRTREISVTGASNKSYVRYENGYWADATSFSDVSEKREYDSKGRLEYIYGRLAGSSYQTAKIYTYYGNTAYPNVVTDQGIPTTYSYSWGTTGENTVAQTDAASNVRYTQYNAKGLISRVWGSAANPTEYSYDNLGRRVGLTTWRAGDFSDSTWPSLADGAQTLWNLELATGLLKEKTHADGNKWTYTYTALGQPATRLWARSVSGARVTTTYGYYDGTEGAGHTSYKTQQLKSVSYNDGVTTSLGYTYKRSGAPAVVTDATGSRTFNYHSNGRLDSESLSAFFGSRSINQTYSGTMPTGFEVKQGILVEGGMLANFDASTGRVASLDGLGSLPTFTPGYLTGSDWVESWTSGSYSRSQNLATARDVVKTATTSWGSTVMASFDSTFNTRGLRETTTNSGAMTSAGTTTLGYNARYELTSGDESNGTAKDFTWNYDLIGKRTSASEAGVATTYSSVSTASQDVNKYDSISGKNAETGLNYDIDGNLTRDGTWDYYYDAENRLSSMSNRHVTQTLQFTYDYMGRRVRKTVTGVGASTTTYVWNGWKLIEELDAGNGLIRSYVWGADFSNASGVASGAGGLLAVNYYGNNYYPAFDNHGNIVGYLNAAGGVSATYEYNAFGEVISSSGASDHFTLGYAGQITDRETGLVYYGMRYYNPKHGKFMCRDPKEEFGGLNLYAFVANAPMNLWDYLGLEVVPQPPFYVYGDRWNDWNLGGFSGFGGFGGGGGSFDGSGEESRVGVDTTPDQTTGPDAPDSKDADRRKQCEELHKQLIANNNEVARQSALASRLMNHRENMANYFDQNNPTFAGSLGGAFFDIAEFGVEAFVPEGPGKILAASAFRTQTLANAGRGDGYDKVSGMANATMGLTTTTLTYSGAAAGSKVLGRAGPWAAVGVVTIKLGENLAPYFIQKSYSSDVLRSIDSSIRMANASANSGNLHGMNLGTAWATLKCSDFIK